MREVPFNLQVQVKTNMLDPGDPISTINILTTFKQLSDSKRFHEGTAMWGIQHFMTKSVTAASLTSRQYLTNKKFSDKLEGMISF